MTFVDFLSKHDQPGAVVLLEGKRKVPAENQDRFTIKAAYILRDTVKAIGIPLIDQRVWTGWLKESPL
jgi:hypothetical protein